MKSLTLAQSKYTFLVLAPAQDTGMKHGPA